MQEERGGRGVLLVLVADDVDAGKPEERQEVGGHELVARVDAVFAVEHAADQHQLIADVREAHFLRELVDLVVEDAVEHDEARAVAVLDMEA